MCAHASKSCTWVTAREHTAAQSASTWSPRTERDLQGIEFFATVDRSAAKWVPRVRQVRERARSERERVRASESERGRELEGESKGERGGEREGERWREGGRERERGEREKRERGEKAREKSEEIDQ